MGRTNIPIQKLKLSTRGLTADRIFEIERLIKRLESSGEPLTESVMQLLVYYDHLRNGGLHFSAQVKHNVGKGSWFFGLPRMQTSFEFQTQRR